MSQRFDVLVVGGGIVGLSAALSMSLRGYKIAMIDAGPLNAEDDKDNIRVYAINGASQTLLTQLGVWPLLPSACISTYHHMTVWDPLTQAHIDFDSRFIASPYLGAIMKELDLKKALFKQIEKQENITLFPHCAIDSVLEHEAGIRISTHKQSWDGALLMIADGANSSLRRQLKVEVTQWPYHQNALVATVATEKSHEHTAYQAFHTDGPLAFLPLADAHHCSIVWTTSPVRVNELMALDEGQFNKALTNALGQRLGEVQIKSARHQFPLHMRHVKQYTGLHWLLLGDAAHTIHPLAGLGLNVGLADLRAWLDGLDASPGVLVSKKLLGRYQRERKHAVWQIILLMEGFKRLFGTSMAPIPALRGFGLRLCNQVIPVKRLFIEHAAG